MNRRWSRRVAASAALVAAVTVGTAVPAGAHTQTGVVPTNYKSSVVSITPTVPGLRMHLLELGRLVELTNTSGTEVVVLGYEGEPYLRVGPSGAFENRRSTSYGQNKVAATTTTTTVGTAPASAPDVAQEPEWHKISDSQEVRWRDHRTRWEGPAPDAVRTNRQQRQLVSTWTVELRRDGTPVVIAGNIAWVPPPRTTIPLLLAALVLAGGVMVLAYSARWGPRLSGVLALLVAVDIALSIGAATFDSPATSSVLFKLFLGGLITVGGWIAAGFAIGWLQDRNELGLYVGAFSATVVLLYGGLGGATSLGVSQVPFTTPAAFTRAGIAVSLGLSLGMVLAVPVVWRRHLFPPKDRGREAAGPDNAAPAGPRP